MNIDVTIIIPVLNEENYIEECLESVINFDYPKNSLEIIFVDGMSEDNTIAILKEYQKKFPFIKILKNIKKTVPYAMNLGIKNAKGKYICRLDAHAKYPSNYVSELHKWSQKLNADNVGTVCVTDIKNNTNTSKAIQFVMSDKFGVGNSLFRIGIDKAMEVDTVPFGFYKKEIFEKIGLYDERLIRAQDLELNKRLKKNKGRIYLIPNLKCTYYPRETIKSFFYNRFQTGRWVILSSYFTNSLKSISIRHIIPLIFTLVLMFYLSLSFINDSFLYIFFAILFLYSSILLIRAYILKKDFLLSFNILFIYFILHISYGMGSIKALTEILTGKIK